MCINTSNVKSKVSVSYNVKSDFDKIKSENILLLFSGGLPNDLYFSAFSEKDIVQINYYSDKLFLLSDYLKKQENCSTEFYAKEFCRFILNAEENSFLLGLDQIFCDKNGLYFIPSLIDNSASEPIQAVRAFLKNLADISEKCFSEINEICTFAQDDNVTVTDIINYIDNYKKISEESETVRKCPQCSKVYEEKYTFCIKCGSELQETEKESEPDIQDTDENITADGEEQAKSDETFENEDSSEKAGVKKIKHLKVKQFKHSTQQDAEKTAEPKTENSKPKENNNEHLADEEHIALKTEEKASERAEQISSDAAKSRYSETTLLGFTNYGETAVLNGVSNNFAMPNLIKKSTGEKVYISKRKFVIGKSAEKADYAVNNSAVSRVHAEISVVGSEYYITDKGSTNHTYVNHSEVFPNSPQQIFDGDEIMFANEVFTFHFQ